MISRIRGKLLQVGENRIEIEAGALVYEVLVPAASLTALRGRLQTEIELYTLHYLENIQSGNSNPRLIGFLAETDKEFFEQFIKVPGVGPKTALKALVIPPAQAARAIEAGDARALSEMPGIGKRTADKIIAELRGKLQKFSLLAPEAPGPAAPVSDFEGEALEVLARLGYKPFEAERMVRKVMVQKPELATVDELVAEIFRQQAPAAVERVR